MNRFVVLPMVVAGAVALSGCFDGDSDSSDDVVRSEVRIIHASPDAPPVNILVNGDAAVEGADYKQAAVLTIHKALSRKGGGTKGTGLSE